MILKGKRGLIMGVANDKSIAWGIAKACAAQGAELGFTYQGDVFKKRVEPLVQSLGGSPLMIEYQIDFKRIINRKLVLGIADGKTLVDGKVIYEAKDLRVGLFENTRDLSA